MREYLYNYLYTSYRYASTCTTYCLYARIYVLYAYMYKLRYLVRVRKAYAVAQGGASLCTVLRRTACD